MQWDKLIRKQKMPPFRPSLRVSNFDPDYTSLALDNDFILGSPNETDATFVSFEYTRNQEDEPKTPENYAYCDISSISTATSKSVGVGSRNYSQNDINPHKRTNSRAFTNLDYSTSSNTSRTNDTSGFSLNSLKNKKPRVINISPFGIAAKPAKMIRKISDISDKEKGLTVNMAENLPSYTERAEEYLSSQED